MPLKDFGKYFFTLLAVGLTACGGRKSIEATSQAAEGRAYFTGYGCNTCHRVGGEGGILGPDLTYVGFRKSPEWLDLWLKDPPAWKKNTLMPNFYLKGHQRQAMVAYLSSLKGEAYQGESAPWNRAELAGDPVRRGETIFRSVGCVGCHGVSGQGGQPNNNVAGELIPALTKVAEGYTREELDKKIRLGSHPQKDRSDLPDPMISTPTWGQVLKDDEIHDLVEYLYSLRPVPSSEEAW